MNQNSELFFSPGTCLKLGFSLDDLKEFNSAINIFRMSKGRESKPHIGIYGRRNNGKSSLINCLAGQDIAIVSDQAGTTTDPVKKSFEITGFGPVILSIPPG